MHHILVFLCNSLSDEDIGSSSVCDSASQNVTSCKGEGSILGGWAVGGNERSILESVYILYHVQCAYWQ